MNIMGLKDCSLRKKILSNRTVSEDLRGKHELRANKTPIIIRVNIESFIKSLPSEPTYYGRNMNKNI